MDTPQFTAEMYESLANVIVRMFALRQKYQQMTREMAQTIEAIKQNDRTLGGEKSQRLDRKSTRLNSSHVSESRMPSSA